MVTSLLLPTAYLGGCIAAMSAFSYVYRRATSKFQIDINEMFERLMN
jgi:translocation protein SEC66